MMPKVLKTNVHEMLTFLEHRIHKAKLEADLRNESSGKNITRL